MVAQDKKFFFDVPMSALSKPDQFPEFATLFSAVESDYGVHRLADFDHEHEFGEGRFVRKVAFGNDPQGPPTRCSAIFFKIEDERAHGCVVQDFDEFITA